MIRVNGGGFEGGISLTLTRFHSCELPQLYEAIKGQRSACGQAHNLGPKGNISFIIFCSFTDLLLSLLSWRDAC